MLFDTKLGVLLDSEHVEHISSTLKRDCVFPSFRVLKRYQVRALSVFRCVEGQEFYVCNFRPAYNLPRKDFKSPHILLTFQSKYINDRDWIDRVICNFDNELDLFLLINLHW